MRHPTTIETLRAYTYGVTDNSNGTPYDPQRCGFEIWSRNGQPVDPYQCSRKPRSGELYCARHLRAMEEASKYTVK